MNPVRLCQIMESRRSMREPPLLQPPTRWNDCKTSTLRKGAKEIVDIHVYLRKFRVQKCSEKTPIVCVISESEYNRNGPWKVSTATEISFCKSAMTIKSENNVLSSGSRFTCSAAFVHLPGVFAVEFQLEHCQLIKIDICELSMTDCASLGYAMFSVSELVVCKIGSISRSLINDKTGSVIAEATISCTLRPRPHSILMQFAAKNLVKKNILSVNSTQIFFEVHRVESTSSSLFANMLASANSSYNNIQTCQKKTEMATSVTSAHLFNVSNDEMNDGVRNASSSSPRNTTSINTLLVPTRTTTVLYRSELVKYSSSRIVWRAFTLQSNEISGRVLELVCMYRDAKTSKASLGRFFTEFEQLKNGPSPDNIYFLIYENSRNQQKTCGIFELLRVTKIALPSFLEYISTGCTLNFACAVDFSRAAMPAAADEMVVRRYVDDVELILSAIGEPLRHFNTGNNFPAFGFGAKIPPQFRESQEFCLNLETAPYCRGLDGIQNAFRSTFAIVQPINIAHLSHVIYYVTKLAQSTINRVQASNASTTTALVSPMSSNASVGEQPSYFILLIITRGVFDDLKETVQSIIFASRAPVSIVFVTLDDDIESSKAATLGDKRFGPKTSVFYGEPPSGNFESAANSAADEHILSQSCVYSQPHAVTGTSDLERLALAGTRLNYHGRRADRDCTQFVSMAQCRREEISSIGLKALISERALSNIPWQMSTWLTKNGFKANSAIIADPIIDVGVNNTTKTESRGATTSFSNYTFEAADYGDERKSNGVRRKSRLLAANVGTQIRQLAGRRCRGKIWCRHGPSNSVFFNNFGNVEDEDGVGKYDKD